MNRTGYTTHTIAIRCALAAVTVAACLWFAPQARAGIDVRINIGNAPPPPQFVFHSRPHERYYAREGIYMVDDDAIGDYDVFRYGGYYWVFSDGYWYRARYWRGPFFVVRPSYVPARFYRVPSSHWKHHPNGPPGRMPYGGGRQENMRPGGDPRDHMRPGNPSHAPMAPRVSPPARGPQGGGHAAPERPQVSPPARAPQGGGPAVHGKQDKRPPGQQKKDDKHDDRGNGHGKK